MSFWFCFLVTLLNEVSSCHHLQHTVVLLQGHKTPLEDPNVLQEKVSHMQTRIEMHRQMQPFLSLKGGHSHFTSPAPTLSQHDVPSETQLHPNLALRQVSFRQHTQTSSLRLENSFLLGRQFVVRFHQTVKCGGFHFYSWMIFLSLFRNKGSDPFLTLNQIRYAL